MEKRKVTKAEQKKLDAANKKEFIACAFQTVMNVLTETTSDVSGGTKVQIAFTNHNRYIRFNAYGMSAGILIYRDGNIELKLTEAFHNPHTEQLFKFTLDKSAQQDFRQQFQKMLEWLIPEFFGKGAADFHTFMDYVSGSTSVVEAHEKMCEEWRNEICRKKLKTEP